MIARTAAPLSLASFVLLLLGACTGMRSGSDRAPPPDAGDDTSDAGDSALDPTDGAASLDAPTADASVVACEGGACVDGPITTPKVTCVRRRARVSGDVNGDGRGDITLTGGFIGDTTTPWNTVPVAFSAGDGRFKVTNRNVPDFALWATQGAQAVAGDIDGDGREDLMLAGGGWWNTVPVARSSPSNLGDGYFEASNERDDAFAARAAEAGAKLLSGDFDGDGKFDLALVGGAGWVDIPVSFSNGDDTFRTVVHDAPAFTLRAAESARALSGDFDADGLWDLALVGGANTPSAILIAYSHGDGTFRTLETTLPALAPLASDATALAVSGDFDSDGRDDIALAGGAGWSRVAIAFARGPALFTLSLASAPAFSALAQQSPQIVALDADGDGCTDLALTGGVLPGTTSPWTTIPVAFSLGDGSFRLTTEVVQDFPLYATQNGAKAVAASQAHR
jgi:hypothetical protein